MFANIDRLRRILATPIGPDAPPDRATTATNRVTLRGADASETINTLHARMRAFQIRYGRREDARLVVSRDTYQRLAEHFIMVTGVREDVPILPTRIFGIDVIQVETPGVFEVVHREPQTQFLYGTEWPMAGSEDSPVLPPDFGLRPGIGRGLTAGETLQEAAALAGGSTVIPADTIQTLLDLARTDDEASFKALARMSGIADADIDGVWTGTLTRLRRERA